MVQTFFWGSKMCTLDSSLLLTWIPDTILLARLSYCWSPNFPAANIPLVTYICISVWSMCCVFICHFCNFKKHTFLREATTYWWVKVSWIVTVLCDSPLHSAPLIFDFLAFWYQELTRVLFLRIASWAPYYMASPQMTISPYLHFTKGFILLFVAFVSFKKLHNLQIHMYVL